MTADTDQNINAPRWVVLISAILVGWNLFLLYSFLMIFALAMTHMGFRLMIPFGGVEFYFELAIVFGIAFWLARKAALKFRGWIKNKSPQTNYIVLFCLIIATLLLFPAPFQFSVSG